MSKISENAIYNRAMPWWNEDIYGTGLLGMRLLRKKSIKEVADLVDERVSYLKILEEDSQIPVLPHIAAKYMISLSCNMNHVYQFREIVDGRSSDFNDTRRVGAKLKKQVYQKCNSRCVSCGSIEELSIHHVKEFAKGGRTELENLVLLCVVCHAEVHKDNQAYHLLLANAKR